MVLGLDLGSPVAAAAVITAAGGVLLALLQALGLVVTGKRERERELYGKAYEAAMRLASDAVSRPTTRVG